MSLSGNYLLTVALHSGVLSVAVFAAAMLVRKPQRQSVTALCGLLAIAILPWFSAMRPDVSTASEAAVGKSAIVSTLPQWTVITLPPVQAAESQAMPEQTRKPFALISASAWLAGSLFMLIGFLVACAKVLRWERTLAELDDASWRAILECGPVTLQRSAFRISESMGGPCVAGFFRPLIVVPSFLLAPEKQRELRWALRHEIRHWQGGDSRWSVILELVRASQWWNPFVHSLVSRWRMARERVCDLAAGDEDRASYGEFLVAMAARPCQGNPLAVTMVRRQRLRTLRTRIVSLLEAAPGAGTPLEKGVLFASCAALIGIALIVSGMKVGTTVSGGGGGEWMGQQVGPFGGMAFAANEPAVDPGKPQKVLQVEVTTRILIFAEALAGNGAVLTDVEVQLLMRKAAMVTGPPLITLPNFTMRVDESALIELIRENPADPPWQWDEENRGRRPNRYAGYSMLYGSAMEGDRLRLSVDAGYGFVPGAHYSEDSPAGKRSDPEDANVDWARLVSKDGKASGLLKPGDTLAIGLGEVTPDRHGIVLVTAIPIDATGRPAPDFESARYEVVPPIQGKVRVRGTVLGLAEGTEIVSISEVLPNLFSPISKEQWVTMKDAYVVKKELPDAILSAGEFSQPWDDIKGLSFSAGLRPDYPETELTFRFSENRDSPPEGSPTTGITVIPDLMSIVKLRPDARGEQRLLLLEVVEEERAVEK